MPSVEERFWAKVDRTPGQGPAGSCWLWTASTGSTGYGKLKVERRWVKAHRLSVELATGRPLPDRSVVLHRCDTPACVNPDHLTVGTHAENMADMAAKSRGREARGSRNSFAKLTEADVVVIRQALDQGATQQAIANRFGLGQRTISDIATGKTWSHAR